jgi:mRNA interferase RelE/StbE
MKLDMTRDASKFLVDLKTTGKQYVQVVGKVLSLMAEPKPTDSEDMHGYPYRRVDAGEYRIIYEIDGDTVNVVLIGKRNGDEVYAKLKRQQR